MAQSALIGRPLDNPATRDLVLQINIKAALDAGNAGTAVELARHLSPEAMQRLIGKDNEQADAKSNAHDG